jgi:hypothetical protein
VIERIGCGVGGWTGDWPSLIKVPQGNVKVGGWIEK